MNHHITLTEWLAIVVAIITIGIIGFCHPINAQAPYVTLNPPCTLSTGAANTVLYAVDTSKYLIAFTLGRDTSITYQFNNDIMSLVPNDTVYKKAYMANGKKVKFKPADFGADSNAVRSAILNTWQKAYSAGKKLLKGLP